MTGPSIRAVDLEHGVALRVEPPCQACPEAPGPLDPEQEDRSERRGPVQEIGEAAGSGRDRDGPEVRPDSGQRHGDVDVAMGVDAHDDAVV